VVSFFSVRLAPGVRISASPRGLRAHVGPRGARVHIGGGRTGISTGAGPFTYYTSAGGGSRSRRTPGYVAVQAGPTPAQASKQQLAADIGRRFDAIAAIHRAGFAQSQKAAAQREALPSQAPLRYLAEYSELNRVGLLDFTGRRAARRRARDAGTADLAARAARASAKQVQRQAAIDAMWSRLVANDPEVVLEVLSTAFEDNEAPTAAVGVEGNEVSLAVLIPDAERVIPDREVGVTQKGNLSIKQIAKGTRAAWFRELVAGHLVVSAVEAFAVAPGLRSAATVAFRREGSQVVPVMAVRLRPEDVRPEFRDAKSAWELIAPIATFNARGRTGELAPLDLSAEPDIAALARAIESA